LLNFYPNKKHAPLTQIFSYAWAAWCFLCTLFFSNFAFSLASSVTIKNDLHCKMTVAATLRAGDAVPLKFELFNHGRRALNVLMWNTPMEAGFFAPYLSIAGPDGALEYGGAKMKRGAPDRADYARIKPGGTLMKTVNLAEIYQFNRQGRYTIKFVGKLFDVTTEKIPRPLEQHVSAAIDCPEVTFNVSLKD
jgi:hypothetical protein